MILNKEQILLESQKAFQQFTDYCNQVPNDVFFQPQGSKWSVAQNLQHLITSVKTTTAAYAIPKFLVRWIGGRPNRASRSYEELVSKYKDKLAAGGKAKGRYVPGKIPPTSGKARMIHNWQVTTESYLNAVRKNWESSQLDEYIAPHPLLGKITLRELCYFTIYHTIHHLNNLRAVKQ